MRELGPASRNPYEDAELFAALERLRRIDELDRKSENELGELLMSVTKYAITCYLSAGHRLYDAPDDLESDALMYVIEVSRRAETENAKRFVSCLVKSAQNRIRSVMRDTRHHNKIISNSCDNVVEMICGINGDQEVTIYEQIKLRTKEPEDGKKNIRRTRGRVQRGIVPDDDGDRGDSDGNDGRYSTDGDGDRDWGTDYTQYE